jgi:hypothetical protein
MTPAASVVAFNGVREAPMRLSRTFRVSGLGPREDWGEREV